MMKKLGILAILVAVSLNCISCSKEIEEDTAEPVLESYSIPEENDADTFKGTDESVYFMRRGDGEKTDITEHVASCNGSDASFKMSLLSDVFGFEAISATESDNAQRIIDYTNLEGDTLKFYVGKNIAFRNGEKIVLNKAIEYEDGAGIILPFDIFHVLGYNRVDIERDKNELTFIIKKEY